MRSGKTYCVRRMRCSRSAAALQVRSCGKGERRANDAQLTSSSSSDVERLADCRASNTEEERSGNGG